MLELSALADSHPHEYRELLSAASALGLPTEVEQSDAPSYRERFKKLWIRRVHEKEIRRCV